MVRTHERSPSPAASPDSLLKRLKTTHSSDPDAGTPPTAHFADGLLDAGSIQKLHKSYIENEPFKYCVLDKLFQDDLLKKVKDECLNQLSFTEKETDIYKVCCARISARYKYLYFTRKGSPDRRLSVPVLSIPD
jgi:hypothetical protein